MNGTDSYTRLVTDGKVTTRQYYCSGYCNSGINVYWGWSSGIRTVVVINQTTELTPAGTGSWSLS